MMRIIEIEGKAHTIDCNALTPFIYAEEFTVERGGKSVREDINAAVDEVMIFARDHGIPPMLKLLQFFWAFEKTATPKTPGFKTWLRALPKSVLSLTKEEGWAKAVMQEIDESFFPEAAGENVVPEAERISDAPAAAGA